MKRSRHRSGRLDINSGTPVNLDYDVPFKFTGELQKAVINIKPGDRADIEAGEKANQKAAMMKALRD